MKLNSAFPRVMLVMMVVIGLACCSSHDVGPDVDGVAAKLNKTLPKPYVDGLVMEHAHVDGGRLVTDIRIPIATIKQLNPKALPFMHDQELGDLNRQACADPDLASLLQHKIPVARRFLDREGKLVFEIVANIADCKLAQ